MGYNSPIGRSTLTYEYLKSLWVDNIGFDTDISVYVPSAYSECGYVCRKLRDYRSIKFFNGRCVLGGYRNVVGGVLADFIDNVYLDHNLI